MSREQNAIHHFRRKLATLLLLKQSLALLTLWAFIWGTIVLALRAAVGTGRLPLLWGLAVTPFVVAGAALLVRRRLPAVSAIRALLDQRNACGGLLMAGAELRLGTWRQTLPQVELPRLRWDGQRSLALFGIAASFVLLGFLVPQRLADVLTGPRLNVDDEVARLQGQIDVLKEEALLEPQRAEAMKKKLEQLREEASGTDPVKTLEALDHVEDMAQKKAQEAAEAAQKKTEQMADAETLAEGLRKRGQALNAKQLAEAMSELAALTRKAAAENAMLNKELDPDTLQAALDGQLSPEQLAQLAAAMRGAKGDFKGRLEKLRAAGLIDPEALKRLKECGECDPSELLDYLKDCKSGL